MKRKVINIYGGMGNQMFQYALYLRMKNEGIKAGLNIYPAIYKMREMNRPTIFEVFKLDKNYHTEGKILFWKLKNRILSSSFFEDEIYKERREGTYDSLVLQTQKCIIDGYWQSEKYFLKYENELLTCFEFKHCLDEKNSKVLDYINQCEYPVSVHIRLGDYLTPANQKLFGDICTIEYYLKAMKWISSKNRQATFFIFSNDINKAKKILTEANCVFVDLNDEKNAWKDMYLMSRCKDNIIANSSFSWWAAWLNRNESKVVIAPRKWLNTEEMPEICPSSWIRL